MSEQKKILVIKLGALGDFIQTLGPMAAIRKYHKGAHITLLTTKPFEKFAQQCGYFDEIWLDERPRFPNLKGFMALRKRFNAGRFARVYDLQNNDRTGLYFKLFKTKPEWVGVARGASHRNISPERTAGHAYDGHVQTLGLAGITDIQIDRLEWMDGDVSGFALKKPYVLLVPGCAPERPEKRWPATLYGALANHLQASGLQSVLIGTAAEVDVTDEISEYCPDALNLTGQTNLEQIAVLARGAAGAVGNDTGPMHLIGATACPCIVLFSGHSNPVRHAPNGEKVHVLREQEIADIRVEEVADEFSALLENRKIAAV